MKRLTLCFLLFSWMVSPAIAQVTDEDIYNVVEEMPSYPGGEVALYQFLSESIKYPQEAQDKGIEGKVYAKFVIDTLGLVKNIHISRGIGGGCDEETIRVISEMPAWIPGYQRGKAVNVYYTLPVYFKLVGKSKKKNKK